MNIQIDDVLEDLLASRRWAKELAKLRDEHYKLLDKQRKEVETLTARLLQAHIERDNMKEDRDKIKINFMDKERSYQRLLSDFNALEAEHTELLDNLGIAENELQAIKSENKAGLND